ncbi:acyl-CoA dehydrogenase, C-terminal domain protein [Aeromicrobium marinum DSM 15272]|uniref:Acyl-CoA dehydrogenase, C-terminal domain protein n=1 Tax=Aeromicrobium marinum DSM 15272 TaxID=585531 RepID=E2SES0_9ACTN|nr:acyl-CoA dehydrogenase family protein [Aeromicrobium marinum]EFQ82367.1 acyl-CoA dehydrogenase, C-terminal domain protein [Aeromicrobium marinum DSM 15272]
MRFTPTTEQTGFARSLDDLLTRSDTVAANRAWARGEHGPGLGLWKRLADLGVTSLATEATPVEVRIAFEALGRHAVPGPWVESAAYLPVALPDVDLTDTIATVAVLPHVPYALDADVADTVYVVTGGALSTATAGAPVTSVDPSRRLVEVVAGDPVDHGDLDRAFDLAAFATAAQLLGAGERVLADSVAYVSQRTQFGRTIGSYQAIKHQLADVRVALDFARPLLDGAGVELTPRSVSAAAIQCADAARLAARVGLQVHGAIGYTQEYDLSRWLLRIRALQSAWGTPAWHRERLLADLLAERAAR